MYKVYFKQAMAALRENPLLGVVSIVGTALAICMIMVIVIVYEVRNADYQPEGNRSRMLYVTWATALGKKGGDSNSNLSLKTIKACYRGLQSVETVAFAARFRSKLASVPGGKNKFNGDLLNTDENFWKVFNFAFIAGKPYTEADVTSGIKTVVVCETVARKLFGTTDIVGKEMLLSHELFTVCGVVKDVTILAESAYAQIWIPYSADKFMQISFTEDILGLFQVYLLARSPADFPAIRAEAEQRVKQYNTTLTDYEYVLNGQPETHFELQTRTSAAKPSTRGTMVRYAVIILILLLVPAINLSGMTLSRMRKRMTEIGVCKAFGATRGEVMMQVLTENLVVSLIGGVIGLLLSYGALFMLKGWLLGYAGGREINGLASVNIEMLFNPMVFVYAFVFCLVLNLLSAGIPAYRTASGNIVDALKDN